MKQSEMEALYSQRGNHTVLHQTIRKEFDQFMFEWAFQAAVRIDQWMKGSYYESKNKRLEALRSSVERRGMDWLLAALMATLIHTRTDQTIQQAVGYLANYLPHEDTFDAARTAGEILALCQDTFYTIERRENKPAIVKVHYWNLIENKLTNAFDWINNTMFNLPLIEPPLPVKDNHHCGYHTLDEPLILGRFTEHDLKLDYENINTLNQIEWVLDPRVLAEAEQPSKPPQSAEQHQQFLDMAVASKHVYNYFKDKVFWLAWQYDSRGRSYSHGYHINLQASQYKKALLSFNRYEVLT